MTVKNLTDLKGLADKNVDELKGIGINNVAELKEALGLDKTSSVLCFSTEGDTDPEQYRRIVWEGEYPTC